MSRRPNILFLQTDQQRHDALGAADPVYRTPALDRLAARGVRFSQAVCNVPMCVPSRYSMMTGLYGFQCGVKHNAQMIARDAELPVPTLARRLAGAGYQAAGFGKTHWYIGERIMPEVPIEGSCRGFEVRALRGSGEPKNCEPGSLYMATDRPDDARRVAEEHAKGGPGGESVPGYVGGTSVVASEGHAESWLTEQAIGFLDGGRDRSRPFFMYLSLDYPHVPLFVPPGFEELYDLGQFPDNPPPEPAPGGHASCARLGEIWPQLSGDERRRARLRYAALCSYVDSCFGRVLDRLEALGELGNTFVLFTSDHGDMLGDRGRVSKYCLYEGSVRVPLVVAGPGVDRGGMVDGRPAELVDVVPTLLDAAGVEVPEELPGLSLLSDVVRPGSFAEMHGRGYEEYQRAPAVMYRTGEWKLILHLPGRLGEARPEAGSISGELYRLADDPLELRNLYADAACAQVRERLTAQALMHVMCSVGRFPSGPSRARVRVTGAETKPDRSMWQ